MTVSEHIPSLTSEFVSDASGYRALREQGPLVRVTFPGLATPMWLITRYEAAKAILSDPRFVRDAAVVADQDTPSVADQMIAAYGLPPEYRDYNGILALSDGPEHVRMRRIITRAFTARRVSETRPTVERVAAQLHDAAVARGEAELLHDVFYPLASAAICEMLGIQEVDQPRVLQEMTDAISGEPGRLVAAFTNMVARCKALIATRREAPRDDLISALLRLVDEEDGFGDTQVAGIIMVLIETGIGPAAQFLGDAVLALLDHPDQVERLRREPGLRSRAVPELLRYTSSVPVGAPMYAVEDLEFAGVRLRRGDAVLPGILAANYDPEQYPGDALDLDVGRELSGGVGHLAFGHGPHYCIGAALATVQAEVVLDELFLGDATPQLAVPREELEFVARPGDGIHLKALPVRF